jgi:hypothetical protein
LSEKHVRNSLLVNEDLPQVEHVFP